MGHARYPRKRSRSLDAVKQLAGRALTLGDCRVVPRIAGKIRIGESNAPEGRSPQNLARRRLPILAEKEARLRAAIRVSPAIENDPCYVAPGVKSRRREHLGQLLPHATLILAKGSRQQLRAARILLFHERQ